MGALLEHIAPGTLPEGRFDVVVLDLRDGIPLERQYREADDHPPRVGGDAAAVVRTPHLSSRDELRVGEVERDEDALTLTVSIRTFTGGLFANVIQVALVAVALPVFEAGTYVLRVVEQTEPFSDDADDASAHEPSSRTHEIHFEVHEEDRR